MYMIRDDHAEKRFSVKNLTAFGTCSSSCPQGHPIALKKTLSSWPKWTLSATACQVCMRHLLVAMRNPQHDREFLCDVYKYRYMNDTHAHAKQS
jgi:hypothetical protein